MKRILQIVISVISVALIILVWPVEVFTNTIEHHNGGELPIDINLSYESVAEQSFVPEYGYLKGIKVYLGGNNSYNFDVAILDEKGATVFKQNCVYSGNDCFYEISVGKKVKKNKEYSLRISFAENGTSDVPVLKVTDNTNSLKENGLLKIDGVLSDKTGINMYIYKVSQHWLSYLIYDAFIIAVALGCIEVVNRRFDKNG